MKAIKITAASGGAKHKTTVPKATAIININKQNKERPKLLYIFFDVLIKNTPSTFLHTDGTVLKMIV